MLGKNYPCEFETEKGSKYTISENNVIREKKATNESFNDENRNIFYAPETAYRTLMDGRLKNLAFKVLRIPLNAEQVTICLANKKQVVVGVKPEVGSHPVDMFLNNDGRCMFSIINVTLDNRPVAGLHADNLEVDDDGKIIKYICTGKGELRLHHFHIGHKIV